MKDSLLSLVALIALIAIGCDTISDLGPGPVPEARIHVRPAWSPDGQSIAFLDVGRQDSLGLYLVDTSGANLRPLYIGDAIGFTWSPDSAWIAFSEHGNLYKIRVNGEEPPMQLTLTTPGSIRPAWSYDGQRIAFVSGTLGSTFVLNLQNNLEESMEFPGDYPSWYSDSVLVVMELVPTSSIGGRYYFRFLNINTRVTQLMHLFDSQEDCAFSSINSAGTEIVYGAKPLTDYTQVRKVVLSTGQHVNLTVGD
ncbi:MAG: hypothetical protein L0Y80_03050, partial [Ignavibacteriae bacterium]|nr:hypothetical protein [Ignavibacteriota bacterium]